MRALASFPLVLIPWIVSGCTERVPDAQPAAQVTPIGPRMDWATAGTRAAREREETARDLEEGPATSAGAKALAGRPKGDELPLEKKSETPARAKQAGYHALYARLPKDSLVVVDFPDIANLAGAMHATELGRVY